MSLSVERTVGEHGGTVFVNIPVEVAKIDNISRGDKVRLIADGPMFVVFKEPLESEEIAEHMMRICRMAKLV